MLSFMGNKLVTELKNFSFKKSLSLAQRYILIWICQITGRIKAKFLQHITYHIFVTRLLLTCIPLLPSSSTSMFIL